MWQKTFNYRKIGAFWRPFLPISLRHNEKELNYVALLDSGADFNIFHSDIATVLDIDLTKLPSKSFSGINSGSKGIMKMAVIEIGVDDFMFNTPIYFSSDISPDGYGIVGQQGFFDRFKILFNLKARTVELKKSQ